ncbi:MAG: hypothetical protein KAQ75_00675, partial [Bacteroidales bacterium]|nr:hypothetical protein [Bacteroidales bacterium]
NYSIELKCIWKKGIINDFFGLAIGTDRSQYYSFGICASGWGTVYHRTDSTTIETVLEWKENVALTCEGKTENVIRVEVIGEKATYILNNNVVGTIDFKINNLKMIGVRVCDFQEVAFDELKICKLAD